MSIVLDCALELALQRVRFFPVKRNSKKPAVADFSNKASSAQDVLIEMFGRGDYNSGIACGKIAEGLYLVGFDIDVKTEITGFDTLELLAELGCDFPETWSQKTPTGGEHRLFWSPVPIRQGTSVLGTGIDLRGDGGYLVGPGSSIDGRYYEVLKNLPIARFPDWAIEKYQRQATIHSLADKKAAKGKPAENQIFALKQSVEYLQNLSPALSGTRSHYCYVAAAQLKDFGLDIHQSVEVMNQYWMSEPPLDFEEMKFTIGNAYKYSHTPQGAKAPENLFVAEVAPPTPMEKTPIEDFNEKFFYIAQNGTSRVCWETTRNGRFHLERFPVYTFHEKYDAKKMMHNGKEAAISKVWMSHKDRRSYDFMRFDPSNTVAENEYNTWRGFAVKPHDYGAGTSELGQKGVDLFLQHCENNICNGDKALTKWLLGFMAHIFQHPEEKPEVSLVLKGQKGTGKTIVSQVLDKLIGDNSVILSDKTHVLGHFNSIMEDKLLVTLDEAFWSGDKSVEGILKDVITGRRRVITHKGAEPYQADVFDRIIIIGNEQWLVPATADERRYAVFGVGSGRRQDREFFSAMTNGLYKHGGLEILMRFFLDYDLSDIDVNFAPKTEALNEQKNLSLGVFERYWRNCLLEGKIMGSSSDTWPDKISAADFHAAFTTQMEREKYRGHPPSPISVGMLLKHLCKAFTSKHSGGVRTYFFGDLISTRKDWDAHQQFETDWS